MPRPAVCVPFALLAILLIAGGGVPAQDQGAAGAGAGAPETTPVEAMPAEATPEAAAPEAAPPQEATPQEAMPQEAIPQAATPGKGEPAPAQPEPAEPAAPKLEMKRPVVPPPGMELPRTPIAREPPKSEGAPGETVAAAEPGMESMELEEEEPHIFAAPWQSRPTLARVALVNASGVAGRGNQVAVLLMEVRRLGLERRMGMRLELVNASNSTGRTREQSVVYYRQGFLRAALTLAEALPGDQALQPMSPAQRERKGIDVEIWLGKELP
jgi:hypothetical protein